MMSYYDRSALDSAHRTCRLASTAVNAGTSVDNVLSIPLRDSTYRASTSAAAASNACIRNCMSHNVCPPYKTIKFFKYL